MTLAGRSRLDEALRVVRESVYAKGNDMTPEKPDHNGMSAEFVAGAKSHRTRNVILSILGVLLVLGIIGNLTGNKSANSAASSSPAPTTTVTVTATTTETATADPETVTETETVTESAAPAADSGGITDGTYEVGKEIRPGKYKSRSAEGDECYWARLKSDSEQDIIDNHLGEGPTTVVIRRTDKYFQTRGCDPWKKVG